MNKNETPSKTTLVSTFLGADQCGRLEWWVLDWNETAIGFYKRIGAKAMDEWTVYRVTDQALNNLAASWKNV